MTESQLDWWARSVKANLTLEAKVGHETKTGSIYDADDLVIWAKAQVEKSEPFDYWLATVENNKLTRRHRSYMFERNDLLKLAEACLTSFERAGKS